MAYRDGKSIRRELSALAAEQGGYFTAKQAQALDYDRRRLAYHVRAGNFERAGRGLYRIPTLPLSEHDDLVRLTLWTRDRADVPQGVVSHQAALALHDLSDVFAGAVHLTVPKTFRKPPPRGVVLHHQDLSREDWAEHAGFRATTPLRTLLDVASAAEVSSDELRKAVRDALERGLVARSKLESAVRGHAAAPRLAAAMTQARRAT
jgi:predicted transcriptional regulator of viral defense system